MKRVRSSRAPVRRSRTLFLSPTVPGGYLTDPPEDCKKTVSYCPNPKMYKTIQIVEYVRCKRCSLGQTCYRKIEEDKGARKRINFQKYGV